MVLTGATIWILTNVGERSVPKGAAFVSARHSTDEDWHRKVWAKSRRIRGVRGVYASNKLWCILLGC